MSGDVFYVNLDANLYCGNNVNPAKINIQLDAKTLSGPSYIHAFRCDGTIDVSDQIHFSLCGPPKVQLEGPTHFKK
jgi:hypothetical protein